MRVALITKQIGHYHNVRYGAAAAALDDFTVISVANQADFKEFLSSENGTYPVTRLFPDCAATFLIENPALPSRASRYRASLRIRASISWPFSYTADPGRLRIATPDSLTLDPPGPDRDRDRFSVKLVN